jgi:hypothetical protein
MRAGRAAYSAFTVLPDMSEMPGRENLFVPMLRRSNRLATAAAQARFRGAASKRRRDRRMPPATRNFSVHGVSLAGLQRTLPGMLAIDQARTLCFAMGQAASGIRISADRARESLDITVPIGTCVIRAMSV